MVTVEAAATSLVAPGAYQITLAIPGAEGTGHVYLLVGDGDCALVDCGVHDPETWQALQSGLAALGYAIPDINTVVVTHCHDDHYGQVGPVVASSGARLVVPSLTEDTVRSTLLCTDGEAEERFGAPFVKAGAPAEVVVEAGAMAHHYRARCSYAPPDQLVEDGVTLRLGGRDWEVVATPGHVLDHVILYDRQRRLAITSDFVFAEGVTRMGMMPIFDPRELSAFFGSLRRAAYLAVDLALPGHGAVLRDWRGALAHAREHYSRRCRTVLAGLDDTGRTPYEIAEMRWRPGAKPPNQRMITVDPAVLRRIALVETVTTLEHLVAEGLAGKTMRDGVACYHGIGRRSGEPRGS